jgi:hypothetical protein
LNRERNQEHDQTVIRDGQAVGDYKHILLNKDDDEQAHAKYLGRE